MSDTTEKLIYLDREFISSRYENEFEASPTAVITRTEGLKAGVALPLFNAGASSVESKSYSLSANQMLAKLRSGLDGYPSFTVQGFEYKEESQIGWVSGHLTVQTLKLTRSSHTITIIGKPPKKQKKPKKKVLSEENYWHLDGVNEGGFALVTSDEYFVSGVNRFPQLVGSIINQLALPVHALLRVYSAKTAYENWIAVPLVIWEQQC